jgi:Holliday junction resolvase
MNAETKIQRDIQKYLNDNRILNWRNSDAKTSGVPDLMACYKGFLIGLEVKTLEGRPTEIQKHKIELIRKAGGYGIFPTSVEDVRKLIGLIEVEDQLRR